LNQTVSRIINFLKSLPTRHWLFGFLLIAATFLAYLPALRGGFVWDDDSWTTNLTGLFQDASGLRSIWFHPTTLQQYYPLTGTTFWLDYQLWKFWTTPYHIENVLLHALAALLFWRLLLRLQIPGAGLAAALFALHPVMVESAAWITERKNVLSLVLFLAAFLAYLRHTERVTSVKCQVTRNDSILSRACQAEASERRLVTCHVSLLYCLSLLFFLGALLAKTTTFSLPAAILLILWWQRGSLRWRQDVLPTLPFFVLAIGLCAVTFWLEKNCVGAQGADFDLSFSQRCLVAGRVFWFYPAKLLWPAGLCFVYPRWQPDSGVWWQWLYPAGALGVLAVLWLARGRIGRGPLTALLFYVGTLFPVLGFMNAYFMRYSFVCDHWVYLSSLGIIALVAALVARAAERLKQPALVYGFAAMVLPVLGVLTWRQCRMYANMETLWHTTLDRNPDCWMAHNNLGIAWLKKGQADEAIACIQKALAINPGFTEGHHNLASAFILKGQVDEAIVQYQTALQIEPNNPASRNLLGMALLLKGRPDEAAACFEKVLEIKPDYAEAHCHLGRILGSQGRAEPAMEHYQKAIQAKPGYATAHYELATQLGSQERWDEAAEHCRKAVELKPDYADAHFYYGTILGQSGLVREAAAQYRAALQSNPKLAGALNNLAWILAASSVDELRNGAEAVQLAAQACELTQDQEPLFIGTLAAAFAEAARFPEAVAAAEKAEQLATRAGLTNVAAKNRELLELYRAGKPAHESPPPKF
jgi:protein O-mannosyl-transferase